MSVIYQPRNYANRLGVIYIHDLTELEAVRLSSDFVSKRNTQYFAILTVISLQLCDKDALAECEKQCELYQTGFKCDEINKNYVKYNRIFCFSILVSFIYLLDESR